MNELEELATQANGDPAHDLAVGEARARPHLTIVRRGKSPRPPLHRGMWADDPIADPTRHTSLDDWPNDSAFAPLIAAAQAAGDQALVSVLRHDRAYCAAARAALEQPDELSRHSSA